MKPKLLIISVLLGILTGITLAYGPILTVLMLLVVYYPTTIHIDGQGGLVLLASVPLALFSIALFLTCLFLFHQQVVRPHKGDVVLNRMYISVFILSTITGLISVPLYTAYNKYIVKQKINLIENQLYKAIDGTWYTKDENSDFVFTFSYERNKYPVAGVDKDTVFLNGELIIRDSSNKVLCEASVHGRVNRSSEDSYGLMANCQNEINIPLFKDLKSNRYLSFDSVQVIDDKLILTQENTSTKKRVVLILRRQP